MGLIVEYYTHLYDFVGRRDFPMVVLGSALFTVGPMWITNLFFLTIDLTGRPEWFLKYKVQPANTDPADPKKVWGTVKTSLFNQFVLGILIAVILYQLAPDGFSHPDNIPSGWVVLRDIGVAYFLNEMLFYYGHRLLHYGPLYKSIHKKHHEWQAPIGLVSIYAHPVEYILGNVLSVVAGPLLMRSHLLTMWMWLATILLDTVTQHCGYHLPFWPKSPQFHDYHHLKFTGNYGWCGLFDWLHGTDVLYKQSVQYQRDRILTSLTPIHVLYPGDKSEKMT